MIKKLVVLLLMSIICLVGATSVLAVKYSQSPMLHTKVASGELPAVEKRLPEKPVVIEPIEEIGQYGGIVHVVTSDPNQIEDGWSFIGLDTMLRYARDGFTIVGNIAENWEFSEGGKVLTLHLRKGIKWSDGVPFTANDIMFWYEDILLNKEITPVKPVWGIWVVDGELMKVEKIDDYTVRFRTIAPYPTALYDLLNMFEGRIYYPKHYLKRWHPRYTSKEKLEKLVKEAGYEDWYLLFIAKKAQCTNLNTGDVGYPTLLPYVLEQKKPGEWIFVRNPYFWEVDPEGNQLPYIDRLHVSLVEDLEVMNMKAINGELDLVGFSTTLDNYPLYMENSERGNYHTLLWPGFYGSACAFMPNLTCKDPVLRKILWDRRFRIALSLAINRKEINDTLFFGKGAPCQATVIRESEFFDEKFFEAYTEYNPEKANKLLDEMGLDKRDEEGYRLRPDGKRLYLLVEFWSGEGPKASIGELVKPQWAEIGIDATWKEEERAFLSTKVDANEVDITTEALWACDSGYFLSTGSTGWFVPPLSQNANKPWAAWYLSGGESGEEPPEVMKKILNLFDKMLVTFDKKEQLRLGKEILRLQAENLWVIGIVRIPSCILVKNDLRNIPEKGVWGTGWGFMNISYSEQCFLKR